MNGFSSPHGRSNSILRAAGSLWLGATLLVLLLVGMACATVFEVAHGAEQALAVFYQSWWFVGLLCLLALNVSAAVLARTPFTRRQVGFVLTHAAILLILGGALVTYRWGIDGQIGIVQGGTVDHFNLRRSDSLSIERRGDGSRAAVELTSRAFRSLETVESPTAKALQLDPVQVAVRTYFPDSEWKERVVNDGPPNSPAVEVSWSPAQGQDATWVFADQSGKVGTTEVRFRVVDDPVEWERIVAGATEPEPRSTGALQITYDQKTFAVPLEACTEHAVPVGHTGLSVRVLRYLPHALVGPDNKVISASDQPVNPAIEVEITGPDASERRLAFARFPKFVHGKPTFANLDLTFIAPSGDDSAAPVQILRDPTGLLHVRFISQTGSAETKPLHLHEPVATPWPGREFIALRQFDRARVDWALEPRREIRQKREPGLVLEISVDGKPRQFALQKHVPRTVRLAGGLYELVYGEQQVRLPFELTLNRFTVGHYPGGRRPRSFETHITIDDPSGGAQSRVISMNHPAKYGGYTFYQSSYRQTRDQTVSYLSVARDPGQTIVFAGYIAMLTGMVLVLRNRMGERQTGQRSAAAPGVRVQLPTAIGSCRTGPPIISGGANDNGSSASTVGPAARHELSSSGQR